MFLRSSSKLFKMRGVIENSIGFQSIPGQVSVLRPFSSKMIGRIMFSNTNNRVDNKTLFADTKKNPLKHVVPSKGQIRKYDPLYDWKDLVGHEHVTMLTDKTIDSFLKANESVMVMFYAPWCHHCKGAKPEFSKAAYALATEKKSAKMAAIDCIAYPVVYEKYEVTGYPTLKYYRYGTFVGEYHHRRRAMDFVHFMLRTPKSKTDM